MVQCLLPALPKSFSNANPDLIDFNDRKKPLLNMYDTHNLQISEVVPQISQAAEAAVPVEAKMCVKTMIKNHLPSETLDTTCRASLDKVLDQLTKIPETDFDEKFCFDLLQYLMALIKSDSPTPNLDGEMCSSQRVERLLYFFQAMQFFPAGFFNLNMDITSIILLKAYEFLSLRSDHVHVTNSQITMEQLLQLLIEKIAPENRSALKSEILQGTLVFSSEHQFDPHSLRYYLLDGQSTGRNRSSSV